MDRHSRKSQPKNSMPIIEKKNNIIEGILKAEQMARDATNGHAEQGPPSKKKT